MNTSLLLAILALQIFAFYYLVRTARNLGSKATRNHKEVIANLNQIKSATGGILLNQLLVPTDKDFRSVNWEHVISLTSHPARFKTLAKSIDSLLSQRLIAKKIYLNIAESDVNNLPQAVRDLESGGHIKINTCADLGPGKKLIPTLRIEKSLPIIVVDDDLYFETDMTLKLMIQHHLTPGCVVASRVHRVSYSSDGKILPYKNWQKNYSLSDGPSANLFPTSGAGTLYKLELFHEDVVDEKTYKELSLFTDDLWWYIQSMRIGVLTKRLPGFNRLNYLDETQEVGLWKTGNQDRNDPNLNSLLKKYSL